MPRSQLLLGFRQLLEELGGGHHVLHVVLHQPEGVAPLRDAHATTRPHHVEQLLLVLAELAGGHLDPNLFPGLLRLGFLLRI